MNRLEGIHGSSVKTIRHSIPHSFSWASNVYSRTSKGWTYELLPMRRSKSLKTVYFTAQHLEPNCCWIRDRYQFRHHSNDTLDLLTVEAIVLSSRKKMYHNIVKNALTGNHASKNLAESIPKKMKWKIYIHAHAMPPKEQDTSYILMIALLWHSLEEKWKNVCLKRLF